VAAADAASGRTMAGTGRQGAATTDDADTRRDGQASIFRWSKGRYLAGAVPITEEQLRKGST